MIAFITDMDSTELAWLFYVAAYVLAVLALAVLAFVDLGAIRAWRRFTGGHWYGHRPNHTAPRRWTRDEGVALARNFAPGDVAREEHP